jgi:hypothetical protein
VIQELLREHYNVLLLETVFDILDTIPDVDPNLRQRDTLMALVMFVITNNQRPGIMQLNSFYARDNDALFAELKRISTNHPIQFELGRKYVLQNGIEASKRLVQNFFAAKQHNADLVPRPALPDGPRLPQRPVGGDRGRMKVAGR